MHPALKTCEVARSYSNQICKTVSREVQKLGKPEVLPIIRKFKDRFEESIAKYSEERQRIIKALEKVVHKENPKDEEERNKTFQYQVALHELETVYERKKNFK
jgi:thermostable 8-oxoguanine DNA glycosylase